MNTFLISRDYKQCARVLDPKRLSRQISEAVMIAKVIWCREVLREESGHSGLPFGMWFPQAINLWLLGESTRTMARGTPLIPELREYVNVMNDEWKKLHNGESHGSMVKFSWERVGGLVRAPLKLEWPSSVYVSHRSHLLEKDYSYYERKFQREKLAHEGTGFAYAWEGPSIFCAPSKT